MMLLCISNKVFMQFMLDFIQLVFLKVFFSINMEVFVVFVVEESAYPSNYEKKL